LVGEEGEDGHLDGNQPRLYWKGWGTHMGGGRGGPCAWFFLWL